jgi:hypothetical protein
MKVQIGRVKWMMAIRDQYFVILQKFRVIPVTYGPKNQESPEDRILRHAESGWTAPDSLKAHFWQLSLMDPTNANSYVCIYCNDTSEGKIDAVVQVQPDFASFSTDDRKYFLLEYMI